MCGIVGFTGKQQAAPILLEGLSKLEYRGYDSAGLAVRDGEKLAEVVKAKGRLSNLSEKVDGGNALKGTCGIGHTRWATHGEPSIKNAHPHVSGNCTGSGSGEVESEVVGVHNGIIENYQELRDKLSRHGYKFYSDTDTEVVIKLVDYYYKKYNLGPIDAIAKTMVRVRGSYALELMFKDYPGEIWVARKDSPMIIGIANGETYVASDVPGILKYTRSVFYIGNLEFAKLTPGEAHFYNLDGDEVQKEAVEIKWDAEAAEKAGYEHFMIKEIHEQPKAVEDTLHSIIKDGKLEIGLSDEEIQDRLNRKVAESRLNISMNPTPVFADGKAEGDVRIENIQGNQYGFTVTITVIGTDDSPGAGDYVDQEILKTGLIEPGKYLEAKPLDVDLPQGVYVCIATFTAYSMETDREIGTAGMQIMLTVES